MWIVDFNDSLKFYKCNIQPVPVPKNSVMAIFVHQKQPGPECSLSCNWWAILCNTWDCVANIENNVEEIYIAYAWIVGRQKYSRRTNFWRSTVIFIVRKINLGIILHEGVSEILKVVHAECSGIYKLAIECRDRIQTSDLL